MLNLFSSFWGIQHLSLGVQLDWGGWEEHIPTGLLNKHAQKKVAGAAANARAPSDFLLKEPVLVKFELEDRRIHQWLYWLRGFLANWIPVAWCLQPLKSCSIGVGRIMPCLSLDWRKRALQPPISSRSLFHALLGWITIALFLPRSMSTTLLHLSRRNGYVCCKHHPLGLPGAGCGTGWSSHCPSAGPPRMWGPMW